MPEDASQIEGAWIIAVRGIHDFCYSSQPAAPASTCQSILWMSLRDVTFYPALRNEDIPSCALLRKKQAHREKKI